MALDCSLGLDIIMALGGRAGHSDQYSPTASVVFRFQLGPMWWIIHPLHLSLPPVLASMWPLEAIWIMDSKETRVVVGSQTHTWPETAAQPGIQFTFGPLC